MFSYLVAALIVGLGLLIASAWKVSESPEISRQLSPAAGEYQREPELKVELVGRITGLADCKWVRSRESRVQSRESRVQSPALDPRPSSLVSLGDRFTLASGLMEITYDTGAKVILQGPVTYEVESKDSGYLSVGKITAKLEKRNDEARMTNVEGKHEIRMTNDQRLQNSSFVIRPSSFMIHTPTATVTDLGTEFGVEVSKEGHTTSHVFRGSVEMHAVAADGKAEGNAQVLHENQSAHVEGSDGNRRIVFVPTFTPSHFIREIPKPASKTFDLVDVVAGGDGFSGRRCGGIDPSTGRAIVAPPMPAEVGFNGDRTYHRAVGLPLVDGVFIPNGDSGPVQVDSAGHAFDWFPATDNSTAGYVWAGGAIPQGQAYPRMTELGGIDYASPGHGLLFLHANKGITFDLGAIRRANPGFKPVRFLAMAGNTETVSEEGNTAYADLWVLVDGQARFRREKVNRGNGAFSVSVPFGEDDRFLTLAATDGGNLIVSDWIIFGDPRLELKQTSIMATKAEAATAKP